MDIVVWLRSLGLGKEAAFRDRRDGPTKPHAEDLEELGIAALGHRRKAAGCDCGAA